MTAELWESRNGAHAAFLAARRLTYLRTLSVPNGGLRTRSAVSSMSRNLESLSPGFLP